LRAGPKADVEARRSVPVPPAPVLHGSMLHGSMLHGSMLMPEHGQDRPRWRRFAYR